MEHGSLKRNGSGLQSMEENQPAILMNLDPAQFDNLLLPRYRNTYLWLGTKDRKAKRFPRQGVWVYFKRNLEKTRKPSNSQIEITARAELIEIAAAPPNDPDHRLPTFENSAADHFYFRVHRIERLLTAIDIESLVSISSGNRLLRNSQGLRLIRNPV